MAKQLTFILGGARSGKSRYAESLAKAEGKRVLYVATAQAFDAEMRARIQQHRDERPAAWQTLEAPLETTKALKNVPYTYDTVLLDCVTLLASNILLSLPDTAVQAEVDQAILQEIDALLAFINESQARWIIVSNEVGMGVVPATNLGRTYRDALGRANQRLAQRADQTVLMVAGLPFDIPPKGSGKPPF